MDFTIKYIKNTRKIIGYILFSILVLWSLYYYGQLIDFERSSGIRMTFLLTIKLIYYTRTFLNPILILVAILGFFISKPFGWFLTYNIFSYSLALLSLVLLPLYEKEWFYYLFILIPLVFIAVMNEKSIVVYYRIKNPDLFTMNLISIISGMLFAYLWWYFRIHPNENIKHLFI